MPLTPEQFHAHAMAAADAEGRLPLSRMTGWEIFPFERGGLRTVPLAAPVLPEPPRSGEDGTDCRDCAGSEPHLWRDEHWRLDTLSGPTGAPLVLILRPLAHHDLGDLPDERAAELGRLLVHLSRAVEALPHIARVHVSKWGDGGAHLHVFLFARPAGFSQLRGTCLAIWDDLLPAMPREVIVADAGTVAHALAASYGGTAAKPPDEPGAAPRIG